MYESVREAAQALMAEKGFKPYSHEATIAFLNEYYDFTDIEIKRIDEMRTLRNKIMYYGEDIDYDEVKRGLDFLKEVFPKLLRAKEK